MTVGHVLVLLSSRVDRYRHRTSMMPTREEATAGALAFCGGDAAAAWRFWIPRSLWGRLPTGRLPTGRLPTGRTGSCCVRDVRMCGGTPGAPLASAVCSTAVGSAPNTAGARVNGAVGWSGVNNVGGAAGAACHCCAADTCHDAGHAAVRAAAFSVAESSKVGDADRTDGGTPVAAVGGVKRVLASSGGSVNSV